MKALTKKGVLGDPRKASIVNGKVYITKIVELANQLPWASLAVEKLAWFWLIIAYLILGGFTWWLKKKTRPAFMLQ